MRLHQAIRPEIKVEDAVKLLTYGIGLIGFLPVARHVGLPYSLAFVVLCVLSLYFEYRKRFPIPRRVLTVLSFLAILPAFAKIRIADMVTPSLESLLMLLAIKFLEDKRFRDFMQIYTISLLLLAASSLLSLDAVFLVYFISLIVLLTVATVFLAYYSRDRAMELKRATASRVALSALLISCIALPATLFMFIVLPRTSYPLLNFLNRDMGAGTGFTDNVRLGAVSSIQEDSTVLLRVNMEKVDEALLYWRGVVLDHFDGTSWRSLHDSGWRETATPDLHGKRIEQVVYLEPYGNRYVFALDKPVDVSLRNVRGHGDLTYSRPENITRRMRYQALSVLSDLLPAGRIDRKRYLQLPQKNTGKIEGLVMNIVPGAGDEAAVQAVLEFLRDGRYRYSLTGLPVSSDPLGDFLFSKKYGNCEYFASAMAVMLRIAGVPARLVGGYRGGYYNEVGGYYLVPQKNAHVWVEAYLEGKGWVRADPTPARPEDFTSPEKEGVLGKVRLLLDAMSYYWNASVINYDFDRQVAMVHTLGAKLKRPDMSIATANGKRVLRYCVIFAAVLAGSLLVFFTIKNRRTPEERIIRDFFRRMEKLGYARAQSEGLEEFTAKIGDPMQRERACRFVREFEGFFYRDRKLTGDAVQRLRQLIKEI